MFGLIATLSVAFLVAEPGDEPADIFARLGVPKLDSCHFRIHIGEGGEWAAQVIEAYSIEGVNREDLNEFRDPLFELKKYCGRHSMNRTWKKHRMHRQSKGECNDPLKLASLLVDIFEKDKCDFFRWDGRSFEWKCLRQAQLSPDHQEDTSIADVTIGLLVAAVADQRLQVLERELTEDGTTRAELDAATEEWVDFELVITTSGTITADLPAEVSPDGKMMTLNLTQVLRDPPAKWSFRTSGLQGEQTPNE